MPCLMDELLDLFDLQWPPLSSKIFSYDPAMGLNFFLGGM